MTPSFNTFFTHINEQKIIKQVISKIVIIANGLNRLRELTPSDLPKFDPTKTFISTKLKIEVNKQNKPLIDDSKRKIFIISLFLKPIVLNKAISFFCSVALIIVIITLKITELIKLIKAKLNRINFKK